MAEVLVGLVGRSTDSILSVPGWKPSLPSAKPARSLTDLLRFAGVLGSKTRHPNVHGQERRLAELIAKKSWHANRWREIFRLNRAIIRDPDRIFAGQVLRCR